MISMHMHLNVVRHYLGQSRPSLLKALHMLQCQNNLNTSTNLLGYAYAYLSASPIASKTRYAYSYIQNRSLHLSCPHKFSSNEFPQDQQTPRPSLFFVQNPFTWIMTKLDFIMLKNTWDPSFNEQEFRIGTKQAICMITQLVSENNFDELKGLLTKAALTETRHAVETSWSDEQRRNIAIREEDIQVAAPRRVYFKKEKNMKLCDVDMVFLAVKPDTISKKAVIFIEINARFHREYSEFSLPEWTVCVFKMPRFKAINTSKNE